MTNNILMTEQLQREKRYYREPVVSLHEKNKHLLLYHRERERGRDRDRDKEWESYLDPYPMVCCVSIEKRKLAVKVSTFSMQVFAPSTSPLTLMIMYQMKAKVSQLETVRKHR